MPRKKSAAEQIITKLRQIEATQGQGKSIALACKHNFRFGFDYSQGGHPNPQRQGRSVQGIPPSRTARYMTAAMLR
jgi:hypothetical protein